MPTLHKGMSAYHSTRRTMMGRNKLERYSDKKPHWRDEFALKNSVRWFSDVQIIWAMLVGTVFFVLLIYTGLIQRIGQAYSLGGLIQLVLVYPFIEELLFRGFLQGRLLSFNWGAFNRVGFTRANLVTSIIFTAFHFINHPPLWAVSVFIPSLLFGYFRDRHNSVYPSIALHVFYNGLYFLLPMQL